MNDSLITHIMPVTFFGGTGGHLVRSLLISAKTGYEGLWEFSPYGNAHWAPAEQYNGSFNIPHGVSVDISQIMSMIHNTKIYFNPLETYYEQFHLVSIRDLMSHFAKAIRICYDYKDVKEISLAMLAKSGIDGGRIKNPEDQAELRKFFMARQVLGIKHCKDFQIFTQDNRVCCITWNMLLTGAPEQLFDQLSEFTRLEKFSLDNLLQWRELTLKGISDMEQRIK